MSQCIRCGRPMADQAYVDTHCADRAGAQLAEIADLTSAARDVAHGLVRRADGGASGKPESRMPLDLAVTAKLDAVQGELATWARHVAEERSGRPTAHAGGDPIVQAARYLAANLEWLRHRDEADEALTAIEACVRVVRSVVNGPAEQKYLGPCGAPLVDIAADVAEAYGIHPDNAARGLAPCDGDVYGRAGARDGRCRTCGGVVSQDERRAWLDSEVRLHTYTVIEIADAYPIKANTIRQWLSRGLLVAHGELNGRPLLNLGEVLDLAAGDAARREEARAERARRAAQRAEEASDAA